MRQKTRDKLENTIQNSHLVTGVIAGIGFAGAGKYLGDQWEYILPSAIPFLCIFGNGAGGGSSTREDLPFWSSYAAGIGLVYFEELKQAGQTIYQRLPEVVECISNCMY